MAEEKFADEILTESELDQVSGGGIKHAKQDRSFLYEHGLIKSYHFVGNYYIGGDDLKLAFHWRDYSAEINAGWAKAGITCKTRPFNVPNQYFLDGNEISRDEAYSIVESKFQKIRETQN